VITDTAPPVPPLAVAAVALLALAAVIAAAEAALTRLTRSEASALVAEGRGSAEVVQRLVADPSPTLSALTLLRVTAEAAATVCLALAVEALTRSWWVGLAVTAVVVAVVDFVGLGVAPRTLGRQHAAAVALRLAPALQLLTTVLGPLSRLLVLIGNAVTPGPGYRDGPFSSESELREMVDRASESDVIEAGERRMIHSVFELGDTLVREVMSPRTSMVTLPARAGPREALRTFLASGHSRVPVVGADVDDVVGVLFLKDVVRAQQDPRWRARTIEALARPATFVPESKRVDALLREMQRESLHLAIVVDEYGGVAGLVTLEDALEEIVGEIADEYDREEPDVQVLEDGFRVSPRLPVDDLGDLFGLEISDDEVDSVGGLLAKTLGTLPTTGARARVAGLVLEAEGVEGNHVTSVLVRTDDAGEDDEDEGPDDVRGPVEEAPRPVRGSSGSVRAGARDADGQPAGQRS
jgi:CBS domain containing-hemolysin-like protein